MDTFQINELEELSEIAHRLLQSKVRGPCSTCHT